MMFRTHLAFGVLMMLIVTQYYNPSNKWLFGALFLFASILPDIDHPQSKLGRKVLPASKLIKWLFGHRGFFHSIWLALILYGAAYLFWKKEYGLALFFGYFSHLLIDGFTKQGVNFLYPWNLRLSGFIETGKTAELLLFIGLIVLVVIWVLFL